MYYTKLKPVTGEMNDIDCRFTVMMARQLGYKIFITAGLPTIKAGPRKDSWFF